MGKLQRAWQWLNWVLWGDDDPEELPTLECPKCKAGTEMLFRRSLATYQCRRCGEVFPSFERGMFD